MLKPFRDSHVINIQPSATSVSDGRDLLALFSDDLYEGKMQMARKGSQFKPCTWSSSKQYPPFGLPYIGPLTDIWFNTVWLHLHDPSGRWNLFSSLFPREAEDGPGGSLKWNRWNAGVFVSRSQVGPASPPTVRFRPADRTSVFNYSFVMVSCAFRELQTSCSL